MKQNEDTHDGRKTFQGPAMAIYQKTKSGDAKLEVNNNNNNNNNELYLHGYKRVTALKKHLNSNKKK